MTHTWVEANVDARIGAHVHAWEGVRAFGRQRPLEKLPFITISREFGCEALPLAQHLIRVLNERCPPVYSWLAYDREVIDRVAQELHLSRDIVESIDGHRRSEMCELFDSILNRKVDESLVIRRICQVVRSLATHGHAVLVGRGSYLVTQDLKTGLHVRLVAPRPWRIHCVADVQQLSYRDAEKVVDQLEKEREKFVHMFFVQDPHIIHYHDVIIDNSRFNLAQIAKIVLAALSARFGETLVEHKADACI
jgi:cytidylate kinase